MAWKPESECNMPPRRGAGRRTRTACALLVLAGALFACGPAAAQTTSRLTLQSGESAGLVSKDALGRPCLDIEAASRAHIVNPNVYDHVVSVSNRCLKTIKLKVCYFGTERCTELEVRGFKRKDAVIGVVPGMKMFRYSYGERK